MKPNGTPTANGLDMSAIDARVDAADEACEASYAELDEVARVFDELSGRAREILADVEGEDLELDDFDETSVVRHIEETRARLETNG